MDKPLLVVLSGAGISAESGIRTFRNSPDGLWEGFDVEEVATATAWSKNPRLVLDFYNMRRKDALAAQPNAAHHNLVRLEEKYRVVVITQNVDDLHERAGSKFVLHLHGELRKMRSEKDPSLVYEITGDIAFGDKAEDGSQLRPDIVFFEEPVPMIETAADIASLAEVFVIIGTSLVVYPAAGLVHYVPKSAPIHLIDTSIPHFDWDGRDIRIKETTATKGTEWLLQELL